MAKFRHIGPFVVVMRIRGGSLFVQSRVVVVPQLLVYNSASDLLCAPAGSKEVVETRGAFRKQTQVGGRDAVRCLGTAADAIHIAVSVGLPLVLYQDPHKQSHAGKRQRHEST